MHCVINLTTQNPEFLNLTFAEMSFNGTNNFYCAHGGLVYYQRSQTQYFIHPYIQASQTENTYVDIKDMCSNYTRHRKFTSLTPRSMDFISSDSHVLLVIYSYSPYAEVEALIQVSRSPCVGVIACKGGEGSVFVLSIFHCLFQSHFIFFDPLIDNMNLSISFPQLCVSQASGLQESQFVYNSVV